LQLSTASAMPTSTDPHAVPSPLTLTEEEIYGLLENKKTAILLDLTDKIAAAYSTQPLKAAEAAASEQIFRLLMQETELRVRSSLAEHVKNSTQLPRDIALAMAEDVEEVALPILQYSQVLDDHDLLELVNHTDEIHKYLAISKREHVSSDLSDTLLSKHSNEVTSILVANQGAEISGEGFAKIVELYPQNEMLMQALSDRPQIPAAVIEKMMGKVSASLAEKIREKYQAAHNEISQEISSSRDSETLRLVQITYAQEEVNKLVYLLYNTNRLTPSLILNALCHGNFCFFETSLARLSDIPVSNARTLISSHGEFGFQALYRKAGLSESIYPAVALLLKVVRELAEQKETPSSKGYTNRVIERILQYTESEPVENLSYLIAIVRQSAQ